MNSLRAIAKEVEGLSEEQTLDLVFPPGIPMVYELSSDLVVRRQEWLFDQEIVLAKRNSALHCGGDLVKTMRSLASDAYDIVVLGCGPAGMKAASEAATRGLRVVVVDPKAVITGAPTGSHSKCLREAALDGARSWAEVQEVLDRTIKSAHHHATRSLHTFHVKLLKGTGYVVDEKTVKVVQENGEESVLETSSIVIATGSKANRFPPTKFDIDGVYDSDTIWSINRIPEVLVVQGAGIVSVEYAVIFSKLGTKKVYVIDAFPNFLPMLDSTLQAACKQSLQDSGIELLMSTPFKAVDAGEGSTPASPKIKISLEDRTIDCDCLLSACGRSGNTAALGLENLESKGVKINPRGKLIEVDKNGFTGCDHVYAAGDCATGSMGLATIGESQGVLAAKAIFAKIGPSATRDLVQSPIGRRLSVIAAENTKQDQKPFGVWTIPDMAWAGDSEEAAKKKGIDYGVAIVKYAQTVRGCVSSDEGFLKLVYDRSNGVALGVHIWGDNSCELIVYGAQIVNSQTTIFDMLHFVFPAVTYHNLYVKAAAEAKLRLKGVRSLSAATAWLRLKNKVETVAAMHCIETGVSVAAVIQAKFEMFDVDKSGFLSKEELTKAVGALGIVMHAEEIGEMIEEATGDSAADEIDYGTFMSMLSDGLSSTLTDESAALEAKAEHDRLKNPGEDIEAKLMQSRQVSKESLASTDKNYYDLIVIGGGPAGARAAEEGGSRGVRVLLIDPSPVITGAPTGAHSKCVREAVLHGAKTWDDVQRVITRTVESTHAQTIRLLKTFHVDYKKGSATFKDAKRILFKENGKDESIEFSFKNCVIATGSKANRFPPTNFDLPGVYDSDTIGSIKRIPEVLVVQGCGIVSCEYAIMFAMLGSKVTLVDAFHLFLPMLDKDLQDACKKNLDKNGIEVIMSTPFKSVEAADGSTPEKPKIRVDIGERILECDALLSATGRSGNTAGIGLEDLASSGLQIIPRGKLIQVDENGYTGCGGIYAAGDCAVGSMGLATMGQAQAVRAVRAMYGTSTAEEKAKERKYDVKPSGVWTIPEIAWAGITEEAAVKANINYGVAKCQFEETIRGLVSHESGFLKIIFNRDSAVVLGVHLCGENSCEIINYGAEIVNNHMTLHQVLHFVFPAVTYHNLYNLAATEGKIRLRGVKDASAAAAWLRVSTVLSKSLAAANSPDTVQVAMFKAFNQFDNDDSGFLSKENLKKAVSSLGLTLTDDDVSAMIVEATGDRNAQECDYDSFLKMLV
jgi:NAD(P) transhydrogenase